MEKGRGHWEVQGSWSHCLLAFAFSIELCDAADDASLLISFGIFNEFYGRSTLENSIWKSHGWHKEALLIHDYA